MARSTFDPKAPPRLRASTYQTHTGRRLVFSIFGCVLASAVGAGAYFAPLASAAFAATGQKVSVSAPTASSGASPATYQANGAFTVLLMGSDNDAKFTGPVLTQSMILCRVNPASKQVTMLSIPRDLWVPLSNGSSGKIDWAYSYGKEAGAIATVEEDFGVRIDHYIWTGLSGLVDLVDKMGGVDIVVSNPVLDDFYPKDLSGSNPYDVQRVAVLPGPQHMNGTQVLEYVRSRHDDIRGDFGRSFRQQQVLIALRAKAKELGISDLPDFANVLQNDVRTDLSLSDITSILPLAQQLDLNNIKQIVLLPPLTHGGTVIDGQDVLTPDMPAIQALVAQYFSY